MSLQEH